jgi:thymidylate kinase
MEKIVFILGLPGSGKSTAARYIEVLARDRQWVVSCFNDYSILYKMFQDDHEGRRFRSTKHKGYDGFDVLDHTAFDEALKTFKGKIVEAESAQSAKDQLIIIEFARDNYSKALGEFFPEYLKNAYFLFIDANVPVCKQRIKDRVENPKFPDDHYVSEFIFETYYDRDNRQYFNSVATQLELNFGVPELHIRVIEDSNLELKSFGHEIKLFFEEMILQEQIPVHQTPTSATSSEQKPTLQATRQDTSLAGYAEPVSAPA